MITPLSYQERVRAIDDHGRFFAGIDPVDRSRRVPACPSWNVEDVIRHVAGGAAAAEALAELTEADAMSPVDLIRERMAPTLRLPLSELPPLIRSYLDVIRDRDPEAPAFLHTGATTMARQVWHVSSDWGIHRHDVEVALGIEPTLSSARAADLLAWFTGYIAPRERGDGQQLPTIRIIATDADLDFREGDGEPAVTVSGSARDTLLFLWRRPHGPVTVEGDPVAAASYVGLSI